MGVFPTRDGALMGTKNRSTPSSTCELDRMTITAWFWGHRVNSANEKPMIYVEDGRNKVYIQHEQIKTEHFAFANPSP